MSASGFKGRMITEYVVTCGAHGCDYHEYVEGVGNATERGWCRDRRGGYGWICPTCSSPRPDDASAPLAPPPETETNAAEPTTGTEGEAV